MKLIGVLFILTCSLFAYSQAVCNLSYLTTIENFAVYEHVPSGAIIFRAKLAIDADGCPRAYGPNNSGLDWTANAGYPGNWWGVVTDSNGDPIIQGSSDPYPGMYVSSTSLVRSGYSNTNPLRYVDSENIPYIALPSSLQSLAGIQKGDLAYVRNTTNGQSSYAYFADTGPGGKLGEGSMYLADQLGIDSSPRTGGTSSGIIDYIVFPQSGLGQGSHLTIAQINSMGQAELSAAGGTTLADCIDQFNPLDCSNTIPLTCGVTYSGVSSTATSLVGSYGCNSWTESGPERVHSIIPSASGTITATLSNFTGDLDVYILGSCDPDDCLGTVGSSSATYSGAVAGQTYYIVVDADDGSGSAYDLVVNCPISSSSDNITVANYSLSSSSVAAGSNFTVQVDQQYSGSQLASMLIDPTINYYISTDCNVSPDDTIVGTSTSDIGSDVTSSTESEVLIVPSNLAAGNYYLIIKADGDNQIIENNESDNAICLPVTITPLVLDCTSAIPLTCGVVYHGASSSALSHVETYGCNSWTETGPERIHSIVPSNNGTLAATISNYTGDLDIYLLGSCDPNDCLGTVSSSSVTYSNAIAGHTYYLVVDADDGSGSAYDLEVSCPTVTDDLYSSNEGISVTHIDTGATVQVTLDVEYFGSQVSSVLTDIDVSYYFSMNCVLDGNDSFLGASIVDIGSDVPVVNVTDNVIMPSWVVSGNYYLITSVDNGSQLIESDENNNTSCIPITICTNTFGVDTIVSCDSLVWIDGNIYSSTTSTPVYIISGGTQFGCDSTVYLNLTINSVDTTVTQNGGTLISNATNATYQWLDCILNSVINGETSNEFSTVQTGLYAVEVTQNGCVDTSMCYEVIDEGLFSNAYDPGFRIYPNPVSDLVSVEYFGETSSYFRVYSLDGKLLLSKKIQESKNLIDVSSLSDGTYVVGVGEHYSKLEIRSH